MAAAVAAAGFPGAERITPEPAAAIAAAAARSTAAAAPPDAFCLEAGRPFPGEEKVGGRATACAEYCFAGLPSTATPGCLPGCS
eukprot:scaffold3870_cov246-Pinguiococcus_pyrenoidosus.AAC.4